MIISSLAQGPLPPQKPSGREQTIAVPVTQAALQKREADPKDDTTQPSWYTHPDEMLGLLHNAPELPKPFKKWRLANHDTLPLLLADVVLSLKRGLPALINIHPNDHWVVVVGVGLTGARQSQLKFVEMLDPLGISSQPIDHTYVDRCSTDHDGDGRSDPWSLAGDQFGHYSVEIGPAPPPPGLHDYAGRFIAILQGAAPSRFHLRQAARLVMPPKRLPGARDAVGMPTIEMVLGRLAVAAQEWDVEPLRELLAASPKTTIHLVKDIAGSSSQYVLAVVSASDPHRAVMAVLDGPDFFLAHFKFSSPPYARRIGDASPELWWTREPLPSLPSPYFPFERTADAVGQFERVIDGFVLHAPPPARSRP